MTSSNRFDEIDGRDNDPAWLEPTTPWFTWLLEPPPPGWKGVTLTRCSYHLLQEYRKAIEEETPTHTVSEAHKDTTTTTTSAKEKGAVEELAAKDNPIIVVVFKRER